MFKFYDEDTPLKNRDVHKTLSEVSECLAKVERSNAPISLFISSAGFFKNTEIERRISDHNLTRQSMRAHMRNIDIILRKIKDVNKTKKYQYSFKKAPMAGMLVTSAVFSVGSYFFIDDIIVNQHKPKDWALYSIVCILYLLAMVGMIGSCVRRSPDEEYEDIKADKIQDLYDSMTESYKYLKNLYHMLLSETQSVQSSADYLEQDIHIEPGDITDTESIDPPRYLGV